MDSPVLVTGAAGFIGLHVCRRLLRDGHRVVGLDNLNDYYDPALKQARLAALQQDPAFAFERTDLADEQAVDRVFRTHRPEYVIHLAAQAGVRHALTRPFAYVDSNLRGSTAVLEACRHHGVRHLVAASSSSVYGGNVRAPFRESDPVDHPVSFYAATKRANELMAHSHAHLFGLPVTMLRYFTVYGSWGRPDMAIWKFSEGLFSGRPIEVYAEGTLARDFTHVSDAAEATVRVMSRPPSRTGTPGVPTGSERPDTSWAPFEVYNVGRSDPTSVNDLIRMLERLTGRTATRTAMPMQPGDVVRTCADPAKLRAAIGFEPRVALEEGLAEFVDWFRAYRG